MILDESEADNTQLLEGGEWNRERWWNKLIQVCRRWRYLVLDSAYHLRVSLVCARGTPVADMLAHSPPVPLVIDHFNTYQGLTSEDEEGIILALQHRDRVRRIRLLKPIPILQKLVVALDGEFPILEFLLIEHQRHHRPVIEHKTNFYFPETFRAPQLRELVLKNFATPIDSPTLTTMGNLVTLFLTKIPSSVYFHPKALIQLLTLMPQLETLGVSFNWYNPSRDVEKHLSPTPIRTRITLPNLRWLAFRGSSAYLEALLPWLTTPLLEKLDVNFYNRMIYSIPHLRQFTSTARNLRIKTATVTFHTDYLWVNAYPHAGAKGYTLDMELGGKHLDWQVVSAAQIFPAIKTVLSAVEHLTFKSNRHYMSSEWNLQADRTHWRELLRSFEKVKNLRVEDGLVEQVSRALQPGEGESSTELLPELQVLSYSTSGSSPDAFTPFIDARQQAGQPVTVVHV